MSTNKKSEISLLYDELEGVLNLMHSMFGSYDNSPWKIDKDVDLKNTHKILELVPEEEVCKLVALYRIFSIKDASNKPAVNYPQKEINKIIQQLEGLKKGGWIPFTYVNGFIENISYSEKGSWYIGQTLLNRNVFTGGTPYKDPVMTLLIILLINSLIEINNDINYSCKLVAGFLKEQCFVEDIRPETVKQRYKRNVYPSSKLNKIIKRTAEIFKLVIDLQSRSVSSKISLQGEKDMKYPPIPYFDKILKILDTD